MPRESTTSCTCKSCISACKRIPGLFHPVEALAAIRAGMARDLMVVWVDNEARSAKLRRQWRVIMPLSAPSLAIRKDPAFDPHRRRETWEANGRCVFLNVDDRCEIHDSGYKPIECRAAMLCASDDEKVDRKHASAKAAWNTPVGRFVVNLWRGEIDR